jgi:hypothetical protein
MLAMTNLGYMHENGLGVAVSYQEAIKWYLMAAQAGDPFAMDNLGNMQSAGRGFQRNDPEAAKWYRKAAERGFTVSMVRLARMYHGGVGVARNDEYAYAWAALAVERSASRIRRDEYLPIALHLAQELDETGFQRAKLLKDELAKAVPVYIENF